MMLRLALVGVVAALGVTLPSQTSCDNWLTASERLGNVGARGLGYLAPARADG